MEELYGNIECMKGIIDKYVPVLLLKGQVEGGSSLAVLTRGMSELLPQLIVLYEDERMAEYAEDKDYWMQQLNRIIGALEKGDVFLSYDALVHEFKANLTELQKIIVEKGICKAS